ncbi:unnamed protein product [Cyclocybe aegerita]|uniref:N-acetyltransferase domain-containing protein n=1 Tax=Cyclocybe aegerita TaxID=1973307 RepID=A0A8S0WEZ3_CYCAE|nr:unnamed protein product [Cyclocybe aegerita]
MGEVQYDDTGVPERLRDPWPTIQIMLDPSLATQSAPPSGQSFFASSRNVGISGGNFYATQGHNISLTVNLNLGEGEASRLIAQAPRLDRQQTTITGQRGETDGRRLTEPGDVGGGAKEIVQTFQRASEVPRFVWDTLKANQVKANVVLPTLLKSLALERSGRMPGDHLWIVSYILPPHPHAQPQVRFVLSCTDNSVSRNPIFIFTPLPSKHLQYDKAIHSSIALLATELRKHQPDDRVYSVFAVDVVSSVWVHVWAHMTGIAAIKEPYKTVQLSYVTRSTFIQKDPPTTHELRPATREDIPEIVRLWHMSTDGNHPFALDQEGAFCEATALVESGQVWVYKLFDRGYPPRIVTIAAFARYSETVATLTKLYSDPEWCGRGYAGRLARAVCHELLKTKEKVATFVRYNCSDHHIFGRIGFVGIGINSPAPEDVETWFEIGFDPARVKLGCW